MDLTAAKQRVCSEVDRHTDMLLEVSREIHSHPELGFEERFAHDLLTGICEREGLEVERGAYDLPTAFAARAGGPGPTVAVMCEYDALPGIGHGCGHNVIAAAGLGAGLAAAALAPEAGGSVLVLGTPAEEGGGGKVAMADRGAFDGVDAAMMVHPAGADLRSLTCVAVQQLAVEYHGRAAHAAASPHKGRNALDAAVLGYMAVAALRQHIRTDERVHGVFTDGGDKPNIVPAHAAMEWYVRSASLSSLEPLKERVLAAVRSGADATGCTMSHEWREPAYADLDTNAPLADLYTANAAILGREVLDPVGSPALVGSTDMGNISHIVPSIHPMIRVAPPEVSIHSADFADRAASAEADLAVTDGAKALAMTIVDLWLRPDALSLVRNAFSRSTGEGRP